MRPPYADVTERQQHFLYTRRAASETPLGPSHKTPANASLTPDPEALNATPCTVASALEKTPCNIRGRVQQARQHLHPKTGVAFKALKQILRAQRVGCQCCRPQDRLTDRRERDQRSEQGADQRSRNGPSRMLTTTGRDEAEPNHKRWRTGGATSMVTTRRIKTGEGCTQPMVRQRIPREGLCIRRQARAEWSDPTRTQGKGAGRRVGS